MMAAPSLSHAYSGRPASSPSTPLSISPPRRSYAAPPRRTSVLWAPLSSAAQTFVDSIVATGSTKVEFIIDVPVWSPGMWTDLSALSQLRDQTLSTTHSVIHHLSLLDRPITASYKLLARSCTSTACSLTKRAHPHPGQPCPASGWGCIRLLDGSSRRNPSRRSSIDALAAIPAPPSTSGSGSASSEDGEYDEETVESVVKQHVEERNLRGEQGPFAIKLFGAPALVLVEV